MIRKTENLATMETMGGFVLEAFEDNACGAFEGVDDDGAEEGLAVDFGFCIFDFG